MDEIMNHGSDLKRQYKQLQAPLSQMNCEKAVVQQICRQIVAEEILDRRAVDNFVNCTTERDFGNLVWMFIDKEPEDINKFLGILKKITGYHVASNKFRQKIEEFVPESFVSLDTRIVIYRPTEQVQIINAMPVDVLGNTSDDEEETQQTVMSQALDIPSIDEGREENTGFLTGENETQQTIQVQREPGFFCTRNGRCVIVILVICGFIAIILTWFLVSADQPEIIPTTAALPTTTSVEPHADLKSEEVHETAHNTSQYSYRFLR